MRAIIVDDEPPARARLRTMLGQHPDIDIVRECETAADALRAILSCWLEKRLARTVVDPLMRITPGGCGT